MDELSRHFGPEKARQFIAEADLSGDGKISRDAFERWWLQKQQQIKRKKMVYYYSFYFYFYFYFFSCVYVFKQLYLHFTFYFFK